MKKITPPNVSFRWEYISSTMLCVRTKSQKRKEAASVRRFQIPTDAMSNSILHEIVHKTWTSFKSKEGSVIPLREFELSELYEGSEKLFAKHDDQLFSQAADLIGDGSLETVTAETLEVTLEAMDLYYAVFHDDAGNKLIGCKQSRMAKKNLRQSRRVLMFGGDKLVPLGCPVFTLDEVFDYLICKEGAFILRPAQFTQTTVGSKSLRAAMAKVAPELSRRLSFVSFDRLSKFVGKSVNGAKLMASIKDKPQLVHLTEKKLKTDLKKHNVKFEVLNGRISPEKGHELRFLQYLDFRLFGYDWKRGSPDRLVARSRISREDSDGDS